MGQLRLDLSWKKRKLMMQDYSYITNFVSILRSYNMLKQANKDWTIYPKKNFKSNKNKQLSRYYIRQRLYINEIAQIKFTKQDYIKFSTFTLEFSESLLQKLKIKQYDRVILYINEKQRRIGFRFYLNKSYHAYKKQDLNSEFVLAAIKVNPSLFRDTKIDIAYGYIIFDKTFPRHLFGDPAQYVIQIPHIIKQYPWIKQNTHYQLQFDYIHNRWEVQL